MKKIILCSMFAGALLSACNEDTQLAPAYVPPSTIIEPHNYNQTVSLAAGVSDALVVLKDVAGKIDTIQCDADWLTFSDNSIQDYVLRVQIGAEINTSDAARNAVATVVVNNGRNAGDTVRLNITQSNLAIDSTPNNEESTQPALAPKK